MTENKIQTIKSAPPPGDLPVLGKVDPREVSFIGRTNYVAALEEKRYVFGIKRSDRRRHLYVIGKSGVGKSKLLETLARQDIASGYGLCFLDPYGEIVKDLLNFTPKNRLNDVVWIDPGDQNPIAWNPLANVPPEFRYQFAQGIVEIMKKYFVGHWTLRLDHILRFAVLALLEYPAGSLSGLISMLTDKNYRDQVVPHLKNEIVKRFFSLEFDDWSEKFYSDTITPLINKLNQFLADPLLGKIFSGNDNKLDFGQFIKNKKIILVSLAKAKVGEEGARFFGSLLILKLKQAGMSGPYGDFYLYIDDFPNLITPTFEALFADAKKYGFALTLSHQYMAQISPPTRAGILGGVGSLIVFRVGGSDAEILEPELSPVFKAKDMINLGRQEFYIKLMINGQSYDPFSAETLKVLPAPK
jgi:hypothetical protein